MLIVVVVIIVIGMLDVVVAVVVLAVPAITTIPIFCNELIAVRNGVPLHTINQ